MSDEHTIVIPLGTGGGVVMGPQGDTNFAILTEVDAAEIPDELLPDETRAAMLMAEHPYWLIDCGPQTAAWLCGGYGSPVTPELSTRMVANLKGIMFTHSHTDHMGGLPMLLWRFIFVEKIKPVILAHYDLEPAIRRMTDEIRYWNGAQLDKLMLRDFISAAPMSRERFRPELEQFVTLRWATTGFKLMEDYQLAQCPFFKVEFFRVDHNIDGVPAFGIRVHPYDSPSDFVFSGDSARPLNGGLLNSGSTVVFHDCQTYNRDPDTAVHCHLDWLWEAFQPVGAGKRVFLVHTRTKPEDTKGFEWAGKFSILVF